MTVRSALAICSLAFTLATGCASDVPDAAVPAAPTPSVAERLIDTTKSLPPDSMRLLPAPPPAPEPDMDPVFVQGRWLHCRGPAVLGDSAWFNEDQVVVWTDGQSISASPVTVGQTGDRWEMVVPPPVGGFYIFAPLQDVLSIGAVTGGVATYFRADLGC